MGKLIWLGWRTSVSDAAQPIGIVYGRNLKKKCKESAKRSKLKTASNPASKTVVPDDIQ